MADEQEPVPLASAPPSADSGRRAPTGVEAAIAVGFLLAIAAGLSLAVVYGFGGQPQLEGALLFLILTGIGFGIIVWAKNLMPNGPYIQERGDLVSSEADRAGFAGSFGRGTESFSRRKFLRRLLGGALGALGAALVFPIRSLGPSPGNALEHTTWRPGSRAVDADGQPVKVTDVAVGGVVTVFPEGHAGDASAQTLLIHAADQPIVTRAGRETWSPNGFLAYSKVCTHVGCPVGLYEHGTQQLLCPCHQSLFDVLGGAKPIFGPAPRSLPQLPIEVDDRGYIRATSDYHEPIGPTFWNRR